MLICVLVTFILKFIKSLEVVFGILFCTFLTKSASYNEGQRIVALFSLQNIFISLQTCANYAIRCQMRTSNGNQEYILKYVA